LFSLFLSFPPFGFHHQPLLPFQVLHPGLPSPYS
jgi:hypothetical protein